MQEVSAQQDESSVGLFRGRGCVFSLSPLLLSHSPPLLPSSFQISPLCQCLPSPPLFLRPPSILATPSYIIYPREFIIQQRPQQTYIFVRMILYHLSPGIHHSTTATANLHFCQDDPRHNA